MSFFIFFGYSAYFLARFSPLSIPPRGHTPTPHRTPLQARKMMTHTKYTFTHKSPGKRPTTPPQRKPDTTTRTTEQPTPPDTMNAGRNASTPTNDTNPGHVYKRSRLATHTRAAILDYVLRLPGSGTRTKKKKPRLYIGAVKLVIHF